MSRGQLRRQFQLQGALLLLAFVAFEGLFNTFALEGHSAADRILYNVVAVLAFSGLLGAFLYRIGMRESKLLESGQAILEGMPIGVAFLDEDFRFEYLNESLARLYGGRRRDMLGRPVAEFVHPLDRDSLLLQQGRGAQGAVSSYRLRVLRADGRSSSVVVTAMPFHQDGHFDGVLAFVSDESDFLRLREEAARYQNLSGFLFDAVTHDLSNSMQSVLTRAELAGRPVGDTNAPLQRLNRDVVASAERSSRLIKEVKQIAIAEREAWPRRPVALRELLDRAVALVDASTMASLRTSSVAQVAPLEVDANELAPLALAKLLEEAATGADPGNPQVRVETTFRNEGAGPAILVVSIHGYRNLLSRSDAEALVATPGSHSTERLAWRQGVRLALASAIVHAHGWGLAANREGDGRGTSFEIAVPAHGTRPLAPATAPISR